MSFIAVLLLAVLVGPERPVAPPSFGPAYGTQFPHELVSDGTDFLAVWTGIDGVYAAAVKEDGTSQPAVPRAVFEGTNVHAAWAGNAYVLVWQHDGHLWFARMNRDAQLISTPVVVAENASPLAIASSAGNTFVVVTRSSETSAILLGANGNVLRDSIALPTATRAFAASVSVASNVFVVATIESVFGGTYPLTTARATSFSLDGTLQHERVLTQVPNNVSSIDTASNGSKVGVAFASRTSTAVTQRLYTFTIEAGSLETTEHVPLVVTGEDAQVVATPDGFAAGVLEFQKNAPLQLVTTPFGTVTRQRTPLDTTVPGTDLFMASNGHRVLCMWRDFRFSPSYEYSTMNLFGIALDASASQPQTGVEPVAISAVAQGTPAIASAGSSALLTWIDRTKTVRGNVMARRLDARGVPLDPKPLSIAADVDVSQQPVVVFTGEVWIVAWNETLNADGERRTYIRRLSTDGALLDAEPVDLHTGGVTAAASNGTVTVLAFQRRLELFSRAGDRIETVTLPEFAVSRALATNGTEFLLTWDEGSDWWQFPTPTLRDVRAMRLDASAHPVDGTTIDIATSDDNETNPIVASDGTDFLVMYGHLAVDTDTSTIRAKRLLRTGALTDATAADAGSLVGNGEQSYALASREGGYTALFAHPPSAQQFAVHAVPLDVRGAALETPAVLALTRGYGGNLPPYVAVAGNIAVYTRADENLGGIDRLFVRNISGDPGRRRPVRR